METEICSAALSGHCVSIVLAKTTTTSGTKVKTFVEEKNQFIWMCSSKTKDSLNQFVIGSKDSFGQNAIELKQSGEKMRFFFVYFLKEFYLSDSLQQTQTYAHKMCYYKRPQSTLIPTKAFNQCEFRFATHTKTGDERPKGEAEKNPILWWEFAVDIENWNILLVPLSLLKMQCDENRAASTEHATTTKKSRDGTNPNNHNNKNESIESRRRMEKMAQPFNVHFCLL